MAARVHRRPDVLRRASSTIAAGVVAAAVLLLPARPHAQEVTGPALTAAFLFNFVKFTTWPAEALPADAPLTMCVVNDSAILSALERTVGGREVLGHRIRITQATEPDALRRCHVLYVSGQRAIVLKTVEVVRDAPVLTVSDLHAFTESGGIIQLHVQRGQLRFAILAEAARRAQLQISARLLALARQP